ncbi:MAG: L,D-transpeptidase [Gammaproteobacteria bacterium]|nr:L,D-transpeptidase [Gammaproteobacteria bacterium]
MPIIINITQQKLYLKDAHDKTVAAYLISSAKKGVGYERGSEKTPLGLHTIHQKIGESMPIFTVFKGRKPSGEIWNGDLSRHYPNRDFILTRILWLKGLKTPLERYIYIHGTSDEKQLGTPQSHGCIRMCNADVIDLFEKVVEGESVFILV